MSPFDSEFRHAISLGPYHLGRTDRKTCNKNLFFFFFTENIRREERISHQKWCFHRELAEANLEHFKTCPFLI